MRWLKKLFGIHEHNGELFCIGDIAFVKCLTCGDESIPWEVPAHMANQWRIDHPGYMDKLNAINKAGSK